MREAVDGLREPAVAVQHSGHHSHNAHQHDEALDEVVDRRSHIAAQPHVGTRQHSHTDDTPRVVDAESHPEQTRETIVERCRVGNEENEDDDRGRHLQRRRAEPLSEEVGHGGTLKILRHQPCPTSQDTPGQQRANQRITQSDPCGGHTVLPAELTGIAHEDDSREITRAERKRREPRAHVPAAQHKALHTRRTLATIPSHADHHGEEHQQ